MSLITRIKKLEGRRATSTSPERIWDVIKLLNLDLVAIAKGKPSPDQKAALELVGIPAVHGLTIRDLSTSAIQLLRKLLLEKKNGDTKSAAPNAAARLKSKGVSANGSTALPSSKAAQKINR